jgi:hypothetical protein
LEVSVSPVPSFSAGTVVILVDASCGFPLTELCYHATVASTLASPCAAPWICVWKVYGWNLCRIIENPDSEVNLFSSFSADKCWNTP